MVSSSSPDENAADGQGRRVALVVARFNPEITSELAAGVRAALRSAGVAEADITEYGVPGAFELAPTCRQAVLVGPEVDAVIAIGAVIRGETPHFDYICQATADGLQSLANEVNVPIVFGVLTTDTVAQARERARRDRGDKGGEIGRAALSQVALYERLREGQKPKVRGFGSA